MYYTLKEYKSHFHMINRIFRIHATTIRWFPVSIEDRFPNTLNYDNYFSKYLYSDKIENLAFLLDDLIKKFKYFKKFCL